MNRVIKFRGIIKYPDDIFRGFWYGNLIIYANGDTFIRQIETGQEFEVLPETVGQFTGLTDKNGKEIYEGDMVSFADDPIDQVCYDSTFAGFVFVNNKKETDEDFYFDWLVLKESHQKHYIIHGSIHDNPELIQQP